MPRERPLRLGHDDDTEPTAPAVRQPAGPPSPSPSPRASSSGVAELDDRYSNPREIGRGGMGVVVAAHDRDVQREVAIKYLSGGHASDGQVARFIQEGQVTGQLEHPNIVPVHDVGVNGAGHACIAMKYVRGRSLHELIRDAVADIERGRPCRFPLDQRIDIFRKVVDAIGYAHARGVIHRDLKPANIMVGEFGEVLVMDWGLARLLPADADDDKADASDRRGRLRPAGPSSGRSRPAARRSSRRVRTLSPEAIPVTRSGTAPDGSGRVRPTLAADAEDDGPLDAERISAAYQQTLDGRILGTIGYMPPEQARGQVSLIDECSDIWALGAILYELLTFTPAFLGETSEDRFTRALAGPPEPGANRVRRSKRLRGRVDVPAELDAIARCCLQLRQRDRYASTAELMADLDRWRANEPVSVHRDSLPRRAAKWVRRHPVGAMGIFSATGFLLVFGVVVAVFVAQAAEQEQARVVAEQAQRQAEQQAREARLRALMESGRNDELRRELGLAIRFERDQTADEFLQKLIKLQRSGPRRREIARRIGHDQLRKYRKIFIRHIDASEQYGEQYHTAGDLAALGMIEQLLSDDAADAIPWFDRALEMEPDNAIYRMWRSYARAETRDTEGAIADADRAIELQPEHGSLYFVRASLHGMLGHLDRAEADCRKGLEYEPDSPHGWDALGGILRSQGRLAEAIEVLDRALRVQPDHPAALRERAICYHQAGNPAAARRDLDRWIEIDGGNVEAWYNRGVLRASVGDIRGALADYNEALLLDPDHVESRVNRGLLHLRSGDRQRARADFDHTASLDLWWNQWEMLGGVYFTSGDREASREAFDKALELAPDEFRSRVRAARARLHGE